VAAGAAIQSGLYSSILAVAGSASGAAVRTAFADGWVAAANLVIGLPLILVLADRMQRRELSTMLRTTEWWLVAAAMVIVGYSIFARSTMGSEFKHFYLLFLPAGWVAARFGNAGAVTGAALAQIVLVIAAQSVPYAPRTVFELHVLLVALAAMAMLIGATVEEQRRGERDLRASLHAAAAANMAAALAHELNQPLASLVSYAKATQILAERQDAGLEPARESIAEVTRKLTGEAMRASEVVRRLRNFFRQKATELQSTDVAMLVDEVLRAHASKAASAEVALEFDCAAVVPPVLVDRVQIEVVLRNLLSNAIDAATTGPGAPRLVRVDVAQRDAGVVVGVVDTGPGLGAHAVRRVFEERRSSKPGGMGIGLSISRNIIEAHDGRLWAEPGPGGRFFFSLPFAPVADVADVAEALDAGR
jgi:signal transduction histidine kinase